MARRSQHNAPLEVQSAREMTSVMESLRKTFSDDKGADWEKRVRALKKCKDLAVIASVSDSEDVCNAFLEGLRKMKRSLASQVNDLRSIVVREACTNLAEMSEHLGDAFGEILGDCVIPALVKTSAVTIQVVWESGAEAMRKILNTSRVPPSVIAGLTHGAGARNASATRSAVAEYIGIILDRHSRSELDRSIGLLETAIQTGLSDAQADVRSRSRKNFCIFEMMYSARAAELIANMDSATQKALAEEKGEGDLAPGPRPRETNWRKSTAVSQRTRIADGDAGPAVNPSRVQVNDFSESQPTQRAGTSSRARRVTTSQRPAQPIVTHTPSKPGRVAMSNGGAPANTTAVKSLRDWSAKVSALESQVSKMTEDAQLFESVLRMISASLSDPHVRVIAAALDALAHAIGKAVDPIQSLERHLVVVARVFVRRSHSSQIVKDGTKAALASLESKLSVDQIFSLLIRVLSASSTGQLNADVSGEKAKKATLDYLSEVLNGVDADTLEWRASVLEGAAQILAPFARGRSLDVRQGAAAVLCDIAALAPPGALQLAADTLEMMDRRTIIQIVGEVEFREPESMTPEAADGSPEHIISDLPETSETISETVQMEQEEPRSPAYDTYLTSFCADGEPEAVLEQARSGSNENLPSLANENSPSLANENLPSLASVLSTRKRTPGSKHGKRKSRNEATYVEGILEAGWSGDDASSIAAWEHFANIMTENAPVDTSRDKAGVICRGLIQSGPRFKRSSEVSIALEKALRSFATSKRFDGLVVTFGFLNLLRNHEDLAWNAKRLVMVGAKLALGRVPQSDVSSLFLQARDPIIKLVDDGRVDVRLASMELLAVFKKRLGADFPPSCEKDVGPARLRVLNRYVEKLR